MRPRLEGGPLRDDITEIFEEFQNTETGCRIFVICKAGGKVGVFFLGVDVVDWLGGVLVEVVALVVVDGCFT